MFYRDISKGTVSIVSIEDVRAPVSDKKIVKAVVIEVADANSLCPARSP